MKIFLQLSLVSLTVFTQLAFADNFILTQESLKKLAYEDSPTSLKIDSALLAAQYKSHAVLDKFQFTLDGSTNYQKDEAKSLFAQDLVNSPTKYNSLGVSRATTYGMAVNAKTYAQSVSNPYIRDAAQTGVSVGLSLDLHKDFWGRLTRSELEILENGVKRTKIESKVNRKSFFQSLRKIYWTLVANAESVAISKDLLKSSEKQARDARRRRRDSVADSGEVAKYESQVARRKANIIYMQYQKELFNQQLKELLPVLADKNIILGKYDVKKAVRDVLSCTTVISRRDSTPLNYTFYDEIVAAMNKQHRQQQKANNRYADWDLKLNTEYATVGKAIGGYSKSFDDWQDDGRAQYQVGLSLSIPLGFKKQTTQDVKKAYDRKRHLAEKNDIMGKINTQHKQVTRIITFLQAVILNQKENSRKLKHSLAVTKKKYRQARISVTNYINDQDAYHSSNLDEIQTQLVIINTVIDYLSVFTETPCALNRI